MANELRAKKVAILVESGFQESEMTGPRKAMEEAGAGTDLISPVSGKVRAWEHDQWAGEFTVDVPLREATADDYDALLLPGGVMNPDRLRANEQAVHFVQEFFLSGKPIGAICHGPCLLIEAGAVRGRTVTSYPSLKTDLRNAGATWVDREVVSDRGLITSRTPADIAAFSAKMIQEIARGIQRAPAELRPITATREIASTQWARFLDEFSQRHQGERISIEVVGGQIGAELQGTSLPLTGISYDYKASGGPRIEVMAGDTPGATIQHSIMHPRHLRIAEQSVDQPLAVEIEDQSGVITLVEFEPPPPELPGTFAGVPAGGI